MGKISKIIIITLIIGICFTNFINVYAVNPDDYDPNKNPIQAADYDEFFSRAGTVLGTVRSIGAVVSVLGIAILGIRYMLGSLEQKANYKETMVPFVIGIAITVGITTIITIVQELA